MIDIVLIHTAEGHRLTFQSLTDEISPSLRSKHLADTSLLEGVQRYGLISELEDRVSLILKKLSRESVVVVCTCSVLVASAYITKPTIELLNSSIVRNRHRPSVKYQLVGGVWEYFLKGDQRSYLNEIKKVILLTYNDYDTALM